MKTSNQKQKTFFFILVFFCMFSKALFAFNPQGFIDKANTLPGGVTGWAVDQDASSQSIDVAFFTDDIQNPGQYIFIGQVTTSVLRPDVNSAMGGISGNHGYYFTMPVQYRYMNIYAIAINVGAGANTPLNNSPTVVHPDAIKDIRYSYYMDPLTNRELKLDFYGNFFDGSLPLIVIVHGGGWMAGDKSDFETTAWRMADEGFKVACINYRLMGSPNGGQTVNTATLCANGQINDIAWYWAIQDLNAAIKFLCYNKTDLKIDTKGIFIYGESAGAITALQLAYASQQEIYNQMGGSALFNSTWFLGDLDRTTHPPCKNEKYIISGVGAVAGAMMQPNLLDRKEKVPVVMMHNPCDKLVRYDVGFGYFGSFTPGMNPLNCVHMEYGSRNIIEQMDTWQTQGYPQPCHKLYIVCGKKADEVFPGTNISYPEHGLTIPDMLTFRFKIFIEFAENLFYSNICNTFPSVEPLPGATLYSQYCDRDYKCSDRNSPFYYYRNDKPLEDVAAIQGISCGPNPATDLLTVKANGAAAGNVEINILNTQGEVVLHSATSADQSGTISETISVYKLPAGFYVVTVKGEGYFKKTSMIKTN